MKKSRLLGALCACFFTLVTATSHGETLAYVSVLTPDTVSVIDTSTDTVIDNIPVGSNPVGVAAVPDGSRIYVANFSGTFANTVSVIDTTSNTVIATIPVGSSPLTLAVTPDGSRVYVILFQNPNVRVIDTVSNTVIATVLLGGGAKGGVAVHPDGQRVYVTHSSVFNLFGFAGVSVIDTATNMVAKEIPNSFSVTGDAQSVAILPDGSRVYTAGGRIIDTATDTVIQTVAGIVGSQIIVSPDGSRLYATDSVDGVRVSDTSTNTLITTVPVGTDPRGLATTPDGSRLYVANQSSGNVTVINTATNTAVGAIAVGAQPQFVATVTTAPSLTCVGFEPPMDGGAVKVKKNRALPHKAQLLDDMGSPLNDLDITAPPVIQVMFDGGAMPAEDVTSEALSAGAGTDGNQFEFLDSKWQFNLKTKNYSANGTYTTTMISGDTSEYVIDDPNCTGVFVIN